jgi:glycosyltransferase involved in cell wall biosynthesis
MKILFISSGNSETGISPIVLNQGESVAKTGQSLSYFTIKGKGLSGYLRNIPRLRKYLKDNHFDIIHAHYSLSAMLTSISGAKPVVASLMGTDVKANRIFRILSWIFVRFFWKEVIVKSEDMKQSLRLDDVKIIPNGVNIERFKPFEKRYALECLKWDTGKKHIIFASDPGRPEKNFQLTREAIELLTDEPDLELHFLKDIPNEMVPLFLNAAEVLILTSLWEGSPNVIKESMACNCPIVSTGVGDVKWVFGDVEGCYLASFDPHEVADKIKSALNFSATHGKTSGRDRILSLGLDSESIAVKLVKIYEGIISKN